MLIKRSRPTRRRLRFRRTTDTVGSVSDATSGDDAPPTGLAGLPPDLTPEQLAAAPVLRSLDDLRIDGLTEEEHEAFLAAIDE